MASQQGRRLSDVQSPQERGALQDIQEAIAVCEWCADQCVQEANPAMTECIRLCEDVSELGETALALVPRNSRQAGPVLSAFRTAAQQCAQECSRHPHGHCQECADVLGRVGSSTAQLIQATPQPVTGQAGATGAGGQPGGPQGFGG